MTEEQILKLVREYFNEGGIHDDGSCSEYYGDLDAFVKFAWEIYGIASDETLQDYHSSF